jgi:hypothetical protein
LEIADLQDRPMLFSTFMMWLLAALYRDLPERGDVDKPILAFFFDEAHFLFDDASKAFLDQLQQVVRLIRSKGVGVYFVTQTPKDVDEEVLAQLGHRVQHALRAFTPNDAKALKATVATFPMTKFYDLEETLTSLGIGEALITVLNPRGVPTSPVATLLRPPQSFMGPTTPEMMDKIIRNSPLYEKYSTPIDRESARELLAKKMVDMPDDEPIAKATRRRNVGQSSRCDQLTARPPNRPRSRARLIRLVRPDAEAENAAADGAVVKVLLIKNLLLF